ncbi:alpha/beta-hydrolase [Corynespora cassiicola Philippines]|uniref:Alpha/beta-hydrolase n=1 Tax=Corynespora cassiicola Philippines TaxID=1448308 RepID=A0A2T2P176_CORCC|nr:alpha/beta-hydrolase [Corynespora cassiicola Philippines]
MGLYSSIAVPLAFISGIWIPATLLCCIPWVQKQMLYLHWVTFFPGKWLDEPERAGFLKNQVTPFRLKTKDGESLFAWLVAPLGVYARHADSFLQEEDSVDDIEKKLTLKLLRDDPESRLLLYFHGNSATLAQGRRTEEYRVYSSGASDKIFVFSFDYRGFGRSTGSPSEEGLLKDSEAVVEWALNVAKIPPERIVLLGHSLGTAVATGIAHRYANLESPIEFAAIILCAPFTNAGNAFSSYSLGNLLPLLAPVKTIPAFQAWFSRRMRDTWKTDARLAELVRQTSHFRLVLVHAQDDGTMTWDQSEMLFKSTLKSAMDGCPPDDELEKKRKVVDLGEAGQQETWEDGAISISKLIAKHGDHNTMMKWSPISLAALQCFGLTNLTPR